MPIQHYLDGDILRVEFIGIVTNEEFAGMATAVTHLESVGPVVPHRIADLSQCTQLDFQYPAILALAQLRKSMKFTNSFKSAIVTTTPVQAGMARMFVALNNHPQITIRIFPDMETARKWIDEAVSPA